MPFTFAAAVRCVLGEQVVLLRDQQIAFLETQTARAAILMARLAGIRR